MSVSRIPAATNGISGASEAPIQKAGKDESARPVAEKIDFLAVEESLVHAVERDSHQWACTSDKSVFWPSTTVVPHLDPGFYKPFFSDTTGHSLRKMIVSTDDLIKMEDHSANQVINAITKFWSPEVRASFKRHGFLYKRGILMYGDPGSGKTAAIQVLLKQLLADGGIGLYGEEPGLLTVALQNIRRIEPARPLIVILEDFETLTDREKRENEWLSVLDGESQVDNVVFLATTNYISKLDKRFTDRPSRFDVIVKIPMPSDLSRAIFLRVKEPSLSLTEIKEWIGLTKGFSLAHLKELIISVKVYGEPLHQEVSRLMKMRERKFNEADLEDEATGRHSTEFGFSSGTSRSNESQIDWAAFEKKHGHR